MADMTKDMFAEHKFGKIALEKLSKVAPLPENFRLYDAAWLGSDRRVMRVTGAEFRIAKSGKNKGKLSVIVPKTRQIAYVTFDEMA